MMPRPPAASRRTMAAFLVSFCALVLFAAPARATEAVQIDANTAQARQTKPGRKMIRERRPSSVWTRRAGAASLNPPHPTPPFTAAGAPTPPRVQYAPAAAAGSGDIGVRGV